MLDRLIQIIGEDRVKIIQSSHVFIIGLGGVGGYALEALIRSGIGSMTLCDFDIIEESNLNRQIIADSFNIGKLKVEEAKKRGLAISPYCNISIISDHFSMEQWQSYDFSFYDFVIDACDDVWAKKAIIKRCIEQEIPVVSCMGTGNRLHPEMLELSELGKTSMDPLAKRMRQLLRKEDPRFLKVPVVWSRENPVSVIPIGTICTVPMVAGSYLANYVIQFLCHCSDKY